MSDKKTPWLWVLAAFVVASTRASENGISLDPALFSAIARLFAREGHWWSQKAGVTLFPEYFEHPFLPIWLQGILFRLFGANDTTARYLGLLAGPGSFYFLYRIGERLVDRRYASILCAVTLATAHFIGRMPTFYTEISLTFFFLGSLSFFLRALDERPLWWAVWSGLFLGLSIWVKGLAAAPLFATLGAVAIYRQRLGIFRSPVVWVALGVGAMFAGGYCGLQSAFGTYSYCPRYLEGAIFRKVMGTGSALSAPQFLKVFFTTHPLHSVLALLALIEGLRGRGPIRAVVVGAIGTFFFLAAGSTLGKTYFHYFYPIYPMVNLLAAVSVYSLAVRRNWIAEWHGAALKFAFAYVVLWQVLPFHMRSQTKSDWVQLAGIVKALKQQGLEKIEGVGISDIDWIYREMSLWYWDMETFTMQKAETVEGGLVIAPAAAHDKVLLERGYHLCATTPTYDLFVKRADLVEVCRRAPLDPRLIR